jgi:hypothetical protein
MGLAQDGFPLSLTALRRDEHYAHGSRSAAVFRISLIAHGNVAYEFPRGSALMCPDRDVEAQVRGRWLARRGGNSS